MTARPFGGKSYESTLRILNPATGTVRNHARDEGIRLTNRPRFLFVLLGKRLFLFIYFAVQKIWMPATAGMTGNKYRVFERKNNNPFAFIRSMPYLMELFYGG
jgi:hypothetical protein